MSREREKGAFRERAGGIALVDARCGNPGPCHHSALDGHHRHQGGFTLIEILVVLLILGVIAAIVMLGLSGFLGSGKEESANTEAHQVQSAVIAYMSANNIHSWNGTVDKSGTTDVHSYILNTGRLQAIYTITDGRIASAIAYPDGKWADCTWSPATSQWECGS